mmetsp:Transcript_4024/g.10289  ORF Transcript_4024/g.10289 Transcript_4024/m.10289 type:complete len:207 (+) Transcript_4024:1089-1709(+)
MDKISCTMAPRLLAVSGPSVLSSRCMSWMPVLIVLWILGICRTMASSSLWHSLDVSDCMPTLRSPLYSAVVWKKRISRSRHSCMDTLSLMSSCARLTTPIHPCLSCTARPSRTSRACVPRSMMSSLVRTPMVRSPAGSTSRAIRMASDVAMSAFAGVTAKMMAFSPFTYARAISSMSFTMDCDCPSVAILVNPGMSTMVRFGTDGE